MKAKISSVEAPNNPASAVANRNVVERSSSVGDTQDESYAAHIVQQRHFALAVDLAPQLADMDIDQISVRGIGIVPDPLEQHVAGHHPRWPAHQIFEQLELARQQLDFPLLAPGDPVDQV